MCPLPCCALPIGVNHSRNIELIFRIIPAERHHYVRRVFALNPRLLQDERAVRWLPRKNHAAKIRLLQEFDKMMGHGRVVSDEIDKNAAAVPHQHNVSRFRFFIEFCLRFKNRFVQDLSDINGSLDRRKTVIGDDKDVCCFTRSMLI